MRNIQCELFNNTKIFSPIYHNHWDLTTATLNNLLDFFLNLIICARYFLALFFSGANFFLVFAQPSHQKFNGPSLNSEL